MIHVIIPSYNAPVEVARAIDSAERQDGYEANIVVIDDASTDPQHRHEAERRCDLHGWTYVRTEKNMKALYGIKIGIEASGAADDDVLFLLDGDDFVPPWALKYVADVYTHYPDMWLTYGNYQPHPEGWADKAPASEYPTLIRLERAFRRHRQNRFNHPVTFRRFLWDALEDSDLQTDDGRWFRDSYDEVIMIPMLEMAAPDHYACLDEVLYYYNAENPLSEWRLQAAGLLPHEAPQIWTRPQKPKLVP